MHPSKLKIPDYYIAKKTDGKEQIVKYYQKLENENRYFGYYGINSFHEVVTSINNIRELTKEEKKLFSNKKYWCLPQQFYHSHPEV